VGIAALPSGAPAALAFRYMAVVPHLRLNRRKDLLKEILLWGLLHVLPSGAPAALAFRYGCCTTLEA
jgi:hypothetical protein